MIVALALICRSSYLDVIEFLRDLRRVAARSHRGDPLTPGGGLSGRRPFAARSLG
jgi:hypothetical protein